LPCQIDYQQMFVVKQSPAKFVVAFVRRLCAQVNFVSRLHAMKVSGRRSGFSLILFDHAWHVERSNCCRNIQAVGLADTFSQAKTSWR